MKKWHLKLLIIGAIFSMACTTKVSEWILINEIPQKYTLFYFYKDEPSETVSNQNSDIENHLKQANIAFRDMKTDEIEKPYYALYFNNQLIKKFEDYKAIDQIVVSPVRQKIASDLKDGKLCVMLYLRSGDPEKDKRGLDKINKTLESSPFGNIISVVELDRSSRDEKLLVSMLLNIENDLKDIHEPMLFGVFGRFRALEPLMANGISEENINLMIDFFTADCSCLIKDNLPGRSILYGDNWETHQPALVNAILDANPELEHH
jgi:hypothetical protein